MAAANNPRKFSEKIALHNQKQAEETAAFEEVMMELNNSRLQAQKVHQLRLSQTRGQYYGGSLPNVNAISSNTAEFQSPFNSGLDSSRGTRHHGLVERVQVARLMSPHRRQVDSSPYSSAYLSPPPDTSWRRNALPWCNFPAEKGHRFGLTSALNRTNSDSALHTSVNNPSVTSPFTSTGQPSLGHSRKSGLADGDLDNLSKGFSYSASPQDNLQDEDQTLPKALWDTQKIQSVASRPKSCEVPGINKGRLLFSEAGTLMTQEGLEESMTWSPPAQLKEDMWRRGNKMSLFPSPDAAAGMPHVVGALNTGGSLPDLTNLHIPSPLPTPLDPEESAISGGSSTGNLAGSVRQRGLSTSLRVASGFDGAGLCSALQGSLSSMSLQSSLSNPSLHSSLSGSSLHTSLSNPSLAPAPRQSPLGASPLHSSLSTSPRRRAPLNPLVLSGPDSRRSHGKQFSPTMSPTLSSIAQGIPLDTSSLPVDQQLPPYPFCQQQAYQQANFQPSQSSQQTHFQLSQSQQTGFQSSQSQQTGFQSSQSPQTGFQPSQTQQTGFQSSQSQQTGFQPSQSQQTGFQSSQSQQTGFQPSQSQQTGFQSSQSQQTGFQPSQSQQTGFQPSQSQQTGFQPSQSQQTGFQPSQSQQTGFQSSQSHQTGFQPSQSQQTGFQPSQSQQMGFQPSQSQQTGFQPSQTQQMGFPTSTSQQTVFQPSMSQQTSYQKSQSSQQTNYQQTGSQQVGFQQSQPSQQTGYQQTQQKTFQQPYQQQKLPPFQQPRTTDQRHQQLPSLTCSQPTAAPLGYQTDTTPAGQESVVPCREVGNCTFAQTSAEGLMDNRQGLLNKLNLFPSHCTSPIPDIIFTGDSPPSFSKEITSALAGVPGFELASHYPLDDELKVGPLSLDGLNVFSEPDLTLLPDPTIEDTFRTDHL